MKETIHFYGTTVDIRRSKRRRTADLFVDRGGGYAINVPEQLSQKEILSLLEAKRQWMVRTKLLKEERLQQKPPKEWVSGEGFYWLGKKYRLKIAREAEDLEQRSPLELVNGRFRLDPKRQTEGPKLLREWYKKQAKQIIQGRLARLAKRVGVKPPSVVVRDLGFHWGSCGKGAKVYFHWRIAMLPSEAIDYLILHELCHLLEPRHSEEFFRKLEVVSPDYVKIEKWLAKNGDRYDL
jgi:predicted metal-dependent hydrolase